VDKKPKRFSQKRRGGKGRGKKILIISLVGFFVLAGFVGGFALFRCAVPEPSDIIEFFLEPRTLRRLARTHEHENVHTLLGDYLTTREQWGGAPMEGAPDPAKVDIVIHHTAMNDPIELIELAHLERGWAGTGYHFVIGQDGMIYEGRPLHLRGAHVDEANTGKIGIALIGHFAPEDPLTGHLATEPPQVQIDALLALVEVLQTVYGIETVSSHRLYNITACPGDTLQRIIEEHFQVEMIEPVVLP